jgi:hypothetical protein
MSEERRFVINWPLVVLVVFLVVVGVALFVPEAVDRMVGAVTTVFDHLKGVSQ